MGIVYEGRDPNLDRHVAIKTVKVENLSEEAAAEYEARFRTEARSAARLQHPNIVSVYDSDRDGDIAFLVMEYIQGDDLKHHLDKGVRYSLEQSLKMIRDLLSALDYAHKQGIVHRDIKPANLLIEPGGRVKLTDFGVARMQDSGDATRTQGTMVGTLKYMSPEQVQGQKIDTRADLFSVGVVLYQLLTDKRPFDGENDFSIIHQIIGHTPPPPSSFNARLPPAIDAVVARALAKNREDRFATARDFAAALQSAMRRVEDATVVPPADPFRKTSSGGSSGGTHSLTGGNLAAGGSTVTQEVELVYWKDIKDSGDPEELQDFLGKFPAGIYADLARRRLRKLSSGLTYESTLSVPDASDVDATRAKEGSQPPDRVAASAPGAAAVQPVAARAEADLLAAGPPATVAPPPIAAVTVPPVPVPTMRAPDATVPLAARMWPRPALKRPADPESSFPSTVAQPDDETSPGVQQPKMAAPAAVRQQVAMEEDTEPVPTQSARRKPTVAVMAGVGALALAAIAALMLTVGRGGGDKPMAGPAGVASATRSSIAPAPIASSPAAGTAAITLPADPAPPVATAGAETARHVASAPRRPPSASRSRVITSTASAGDHVASAPAPAAAVPVREARNEPRPAPAPVPVANGTRAAFGSVDACKDKMFLTRELCLAEQCDKPGARNHPLCVKRREDAKLREESKVRN